MFASFFILSSRGHRVEFDLVCSLYYGATHFREVTQLKKKHQDAKALQLIIEYTLSELKSGIGLL